MIHIPVQGPSGFADGPGLSAERSMAQQRERR
jgi:hypothetical protein